MGDGGIGPILMPSKLFRPLLSLILLTFEFKNPLLLNTTTVEF